MIPLGNAVRKKHNSDISKTETKKVAHLAPTNSSLFSARNSFSEKTHSLSEERKLEERYFDHFCFPVFSRPKSNFPPLNNYKQSNLEDRERVSRPK